MSGPVIDGFFEATVRSASPLAFVALGELVAERSGVVNIGLEGVVACGALASFVGAQLAGPEIGFLAGGIAGAIIAALFALFVLVLRAQQIIAGTAVSMFGLGLSASLHRAAVVPGQSLHVDMLTPVRIPLLSDLPVVGRALFAQPVSTYLLYVLFPLGSWLLYRTVGGIVLRAVGERSAAVEVAGHSPSRKRFMALTTCGFLAGLGGATLVVAQAGTFSDGISSGRGFIAIAIVALGRWTPHGVVVGSVVFGGVSALQFVAQSMGWHLPYELVLAAPYGVTIAALAVFRGARAAPAALGRRLDYPG